MWQEIMTEDSLYLLRPT